MTVQTPDIGDEPTTLESEAVRIKEAGEGAIEAPNPFGSLSLPSYSQDEWDAQAQGTPKNASAAMEAASGGGSGNAAALIKRAREFIGTPYKWGGTGPLGFDCSGFTQYLYKELGIDLPRVSYQQANYGKRISIDQLKPGDMVAWDTSARNNGADHIAIYIGNGQVIHAPKPGDSVKISSLWNTGRAWGVAMNL